MIVTHLLLQEFRSAPPYVRVFELPGSVREEELTSSLPLCRPALPLYPPYTRSPLPGRMFNSGDQITDGKICGVRHSVVSISRAVLCAKHVNILRIWEFIQFVFFLGGGEVMLLGLLHPCSCKISCRCLSKNFLCVVCILCHKLWWVHCGNFALVYISLCRTELFGYTTKVACANFVQNCCL